MCFNCQVASAGEPLLLLAIAAACSALRCTGGTSKRVMHPLHCRVFARCSWRKQEYLLLTSYSLQTDRAMRLLCLAEVVQASGKSPQVTKAGPTSALLVL